MVLPTRTAPDLRSEHTCPTGGPRGLHYLAVIYSIFFATTSTNTGVSISRRTPVGGFSGVSVFFLSQHAISTQAKPEQGHYLVSHREPLRWRGAARIRWECSLLPRGKHWHYLVGGRGIIPKRNTSENLDGHYFPGPLFSKTENPVSMNLARG